MEALAQTSSMVTDAATRTLGRVLVPTIRVGRRRRVELVHSCLATGETVRTVNPIVQDEFVSEKLVVFVDWVGSIRFKCLRRTVDVVYRV